MRNKLIVPLGFSFIIYAATCTPATAQDARSLVEAAVNYYRGAASISKVDMTIHRPHWERVVTIKVWTKGEKNSLFIIIAPAKDSGNGTLKKDREMWMYNPKVNRVIKLPPSMMSQSWMGSDFSNNDLAKSDTIIEDYTHTVLDVETHNGKKVYVINSIPKPEAPVVWGMQQLKIREDNILLSQAFYDEDFKLVKSMTCQQIQILGGRLFPKIWKMNKAGVQNEYTLLEYIELQFEKDLPDRLFTLSALRNSMR
ncbi:MAG: outer membrane lipoprotein-sorting protein [Deltaproteobacteria bacterium]|nr:outer membrane lipoprotein-sorting protein [Deltaproteobacteria bacterium]MBW2538977.1 outer membrane lipoprotein-sorting protein [Deltaproteobacteria bacterium]